MQGGVYRIRIQGYADDLHHPHVVVLEFDSECLLVPAFDVQGHDIDGRIALYRRLGYSQDEVCVELDNGVHVHWCRGHSGKRAYWHFEREVRLDSDELQDAELIGQMDDKGLLAIIDGMLRLAEKDVARFSKNRRRRLKRERDRLSQNISDAGDPT